MCGGSGYEPNQPAIARAGGTIDVILHVLRHYSDHAPVLEMAMRALAVLAAHPDNKVVIMHHAGAVELVLSLMKTHKTHAGVTEMGVNDLWSLFFFFLFFFLRPLFVWT